ncbi:MAG: hypothetical protein ABI002_07340, partial [Saprospiraceae bacterium]
ILDSPGRHDSTSIVRGELCEIWFDGIYFLGGTCTIKSGNPDKAKLSIDINEFKDLKEIRLNELDFGPPRFMGTTVNDRRDLATDTGLNPLDYDFVYCPTSVNEKEPGPGNPNVWLPVEAEYLLLNPTCPYLRLEYLLNVIYNYLGYSLTNDFQINDELRSILVHNSYNYPYKSETELTSYWPKYIDLYQHVSDGKAGEFIKHITLFFCLGQAYNLFDNTVRIYPLKELLTKPTKHNWTSKMQKDPEVLTDSQPYTRLMFSEISPAGLDDKVSKYVSEVVTVTDSFYEAMLQAFEDGIRGIAFIRSSSSFINIISLDDGFDSPNMEFLGEFFIPFELNIGTKKKDLIIGLTSTGMTVDPLKYSGRPEADPMRLMPLVYYTEKLDNLEFGYKFKEKLMIYRGMLEWEGNLYPTATTHNMKADGTVIGEYSLHIGGVGLPGLWEQEWQEWFYFLLNKKELKSRFLFALNEIMLFNWDETVRVQNQDYIVKQMKVTLTMHGLMPVDTTLVSRTW